MRAAFQQFYAAEPALALIVLCLLVGYALIIATFSAMVLSWVVGYWRRRLSLFKKNLTPNP